MTGNPFPVMHGSMWKEPQTLEECEKLDCRTCAYRDIAILRNPGLGIARCVHMGNLIEAERLKQWHDIEKNTKDLPEC